MRRYKNVPFFGVQEDCITPKYLIEVIPHE